MNQQISKIRKAIEVFHAYGITLTGQRKNDHFVNQLNMDPVFINGLIFELEFNLQVFIQEEKLKGACTPRQLIRLLIEIPQDN
jgi:acyl carrier protein